MEEFHSKEPLGEYCSYSTVLSSIRFLQIHAVRAFWLTGQHIGQTTFLLTVSEVTFISQIKHY